MAVSNLSVFHSRRDEESRVLRHPPGERLDSTDRARVLAWLSAIRPLDGCVFDEPFEKGRAAVLEWLEISTESNSAISAVATPAELLNECANVVNLLSNLNPLRHIQASESRLQDIDCGEGHVLDWLENRLRRLGGQETERPDKTTAKEPPTDTNDPTVPDPEPASTDDGDNDTTNDSNVGAAAAIEAVGPGKPAALEMAPEIEAVIELSRRKLFEAMGIVQSVRSSIAVEYEWEKEGNIDYPAALRVVCGMLDEVAGALDPCELRFGHDANARALAEVMRVVDSF